MTRAGSTDGMMSWFVTHCGAAMNIPVSVDIARARTAMYLPELLNAHSHQLPLPPH
jgi:hypothetical protein